jgi:hypothetical protein
MKWSDFRSQQAEHPVLLFQKNANSQGIDGKSQMWSGLPWHVPVRARSYRPPTQSIDE